MATPDPVSLYLAALNAVSRPVQLCALRAAVRELGGTEAPERYPWHRLRYPDILALRGRIVARYAVATAVRTMAGVRRVLLECRRLGRLTEAQYIRAVDVPPIRGSSLRAGRALERDELAELLGACPSATARGRRDAAVLALGYGAGLRCRELVSLDVLDLVASPAGAPLPVRVRRGKGGRQRTVYVTGAGRDRVEAWLELRGRDDGPLVMPIARHRDAVVRRRLSPEAIGEIVRRLVRVASIAPCTPHDLRRTYITELLDRGADIATVQRLAGHSSPAMTARYDRRTERAAMAASALLSLPPAAPH